MDKKDFVFISYSRDDAEHIGWVRALANRLRADGVRAFLDEDGIGLGDDASVYMELVGTARDVLVVCTPEYSRRFKERKTSRSGVAYEARCISALIQREGADRMVVLLRRGTEVSSVPLVLGSLRFADFRRDDSEEYLRLLRRLLRTSRGADVFSISGLHEEVEDYFIKAIEQTVLALAPGTQAMMRVEAIAAWGDALEFGLWSHAQLHRGRLRAIVGGLAATDTGLNQFASSDWCHPRGDRTSLAFLTRLLDDESPSRIRSDVARSQLRSTLGLSCDDVEFARVLSLFQKLRDPRADLGSIVPSLIAACPRVYLRPPGERGGRVEVRDFDSYAEVVKASVARILASIGRMRSSKPSSEQFVQKLPFGVGDTVRCRPIDSDSLLARELVVEGAPEWLHAFSSIGFPYALSDDRSQEFIVDAIICLSDGVDAVLTPVAARTVLAVPSALMWLDQSPDDVDAATVDLIVEVIKVAGLDDPRLRGMLSPVLGPRRRTDGLCGSESIVSEARKSGQLGALVDLIARSTARQFPREAGILRGLRPGDAANVVGRLDNDRMGLREDFDANDRARIGFAFRTVKATKEPKAVEPGRCAKCRRTTETNLTSAYPSLSGLSLIVVCKPCREVLHMFLRLSEELDPDFDAMQRTTFNLRDSVEHVPSLQRFHVMWRGHETRGLCWVCGRGTTTRGHVSSHFVRWVCSACGNAPDVPRNALPRGGPMSPTDSF